ncbi:MAG: circularly permuted type 2 ATP-grasp protein, partial [Pseudomonadota bacterium]
MTGHAGEVQQPYADYQNWLGGVDTEHLARKAAHAETMFRRTGITFAVYGSDEVDERLIPFDVVPRIISAKEWAFLETGVTQRVEALNAFLHDVYHDREIFKAGIVPEELVIQNDAYCPPMIGVNPPGGVYTHIVGTDLVCTGEGEYFVLEDNARTPSGVSYMLENRETMMQMFPELFAQSKVREVAHYP